VAEEHAGGEEVARVGELAGDLGDGVDAANGLADAPELEPASRSAHLRFSFGSELAPCAYPVRILRRYARKRVVVRGGPIR
jgi:hypothetical protein